MRTTEEIARLGVVTRTLSTASKSLRLYPATSPIPRDCVDAALDALGGFLDNGEDSLVLGVSREGLHWDGNVVPSSAPGTAELLRELQDHGVSSLEIERGIETTDLLELLGALGSDPAQVRLAGGIGACLAAAGVSHLSVNEVRLSIADDGSGVSGENAGSEGDEYLRDLAANHVRFSAWFAAAAATDSTTFEESLMELVRACGPSGYQEMLRNLAQVFLAQEPADRDALLALSMDGGPVRDLVAGMFGVMDAGDIAGSVLEGSFGRNMLSLSCALSQLPFEEVTAQVRAEVQAMLPGAGHSCEESRFLDHMVQVRNAMAPEPPLVDSDATYRAVAKAADLPDEIVEKARGAVVRSKERMSAVAVRTMLTRLDATSDFSSFCTTVETLAGTVPQLIEQGDVALAARVITELSSREDVTTGPWPELLPRMRDALASTASPEAMSSLLKHVAGDEKLLEPAQHIVRNVGEAAPAQLVAQAASGGTASLDTAEAILGRRIVDLLAELAPTAQPSQAAAVAERLAKEGDAKSASALDTLLSRSDSHVRREALSGVIAAGGDAAARAALAAMNDPSSDVAIVAVRALSARPAAGTAAALVARLGELDMDHDDFELAREIISALSRMPDPVVDDTLSRISKRRTLMRRGHFSEIQNLVRSAQQLRAEGIAS